MKKVISLFAAITAITMLMVGMVAAAPVNTQPVEETGQSGRVSWEQGTIEAIGTGLPPENAVSIAQSNALSRRAAIIDAYRNLTEAVNGVQVDSETTIKNLAISSDVATVKVSGLIKGAKIIREKALPNGTYLVVMSVNLYGTDGVAGIALNAVKPEQTQNFPSPPASYVPPTNNALYTGVIIDARGLDLQPTFSPRVYDETGTIVYGNKYIDINFAVSQGMVEYTINPEMVQAAEAGQSRAGARPLIIKALRVSDHNCNVVISTADANAMLAYNQSASFLQKCAVVFER